MKYEKGDIPLGLNEKYKFGIEIEVFNVNTSHNIRNLGKNVSERFKGVFTGNIREHKSLYHSKESNEFFKETLSSNNKPYKKANYFEEALVAKGGAEIVSPILYDNKHDWKTVEKVCEHVKKYPGTKGKEVVANKKCGLHVHFDAGLLTENKNMMKTFLTLWSEMEELVYKMCNDVNDPIRESTINRSKKPLEGFKKMAAPTGKKILQQIDNNTLKVSNRKFGFLKRNIVAPLKLDHSRYNGLNLSNIGNPNKNTIEFRMSNGTIDPEVIKQNVFLYASIIDVARNVELEKDYKTEEVKQFMRTDLTEKEKATAFTNLVFNNDEDKQIYINRWDSVKNTKVFENVERSFAPDRFKRDSMKKIAQKTPNKFVNAALEIISNSRNNEKEGEIVRG